MNTLKRTEYDKYKEVKDAFMDLMSENYNWHDIQGGTGLPENRCREIEELYWKLRKEDEVYPQ